MTIKCVTLVEGTVDEMISAANRAKEIGADAVEIRFDQMQDIDNNGEALAQLKEQISLPTIITIRSEDLHGSFAGSEDDRLELLRQAIEVGFDYVDLEKDIGEDHRRDLIEAAQAAGVKVIESYHDFVATPDVDEIMEIVKDIDGDGVDLVKVAFQTNELDCAIRILEAAKRGAEMGISMAAMGMGSYSKRTRVHAPISGSKIVYTALERDKEASENQLDLRELLDTWRVLEYE